MKPTQAQQRHDAIEQLRNQLRPTKFYQATTPPTPSVTKITNQVNGHEVNFIFDYHATKADMKNAHHATKNLENNLRDGVAQRKAHLFSLVENDITEYTDILTINSKNLEQLKNESEAMNGRE